MNDTAQTPVKSDVKSEKKNPAIPLGLLAIIISGVAAISGLLVLLIGLKTIQSGDYDGLFLLLGFLCSWVGGSAGIGSIRRKDKRLLGWIALILSVLTLCVLGISIRL